MSWTNADRANRGRAILDHYATELEGERNPGDLVADLLHYIHSDEGRADEDVKHWPTALAVLDSATMHFEAELAEEDEELDEEVGP